jgi:CheY-like chemotaxis protein
LEDILHSIRNPLAVIQGRVDLMNLLTTDFNMQRYLGSISKQCQRIISVLEIAQTISIRPFRSTEFQLQYVVQDSLLLLGLAANSPLNMDITIQNDQDRIKVIIFSILSMVKEFGLLKGIEISKQNRFCDLCFLVTMSKEGINLLYDIKTGTVRQAQKGKNYQLYSLQIALEDCGVKFDFEQNCIKLRFLYQDEKQDEGKTILLVDDDQMLRETLVGLLSFDGYHIITANSAEEALQQIDRDIDIVLMDVKLPGMSGLAFLDYIERTNPELVSKSILISGLEIEKKGDIPFLQKPFSRALLVKTIDGVLSKQSK